MKVFYEPHFNPAECPVCGTIFEVEIGDNIVAPDYGAHGLMANCPTCGEMCSVSLYESVDGYWNDIDNDNPPKRGMFIAMSLADSKLYFCDGIIGHGTATRLPNREPIRFKKWLEYN